MYVILPQKQGTGCCAPPAIPGAGLAVMFCVVLELTVMDLYRMVWVLMR